MTSDDIIRMAQEARLAFDCDDYPDIWQTYMNVGREEIERFAALVAAAEREVIKQVAEQELLNTSALMSMPPQSSAAWNILNAIRARGKEAPPSAP